MVVALFAGCGDDAADPDNSGGKGGSGGQAAECTNHAECTPESCGADEAGTTRCDNGKCSTKCDSGYSSCSECMEKSDCTFDDEMCPPPKVTPYQLCIDKKCSEFCHTSSDVVCATNADCPPVQCPGAAAPVAECLGGGCVTVAERCCSS